MADPKLQISVVRNTIFQYELFGKRNLNFSRILPIRSLRGRGLFAAVDVKKLKYLPKLLKIKI